MPRSLCSQCGYPKNSCVCAWVIPIASPVEIVILQHYRESAQAKNTARLVKLAIPETVIKIARPGQPLVAELTPLDHQPYAVFFPGPDSQALEQNLPSFRAQCYQKVVFLDGNWKQARGMARSLPRNEQFHFYHFAQPHPSRYQIRHTREKAALSTLEAVALMLEQAFALDTSALRELQQGFQRQWQSPVAHRRRIQDLSV